MNWPTTPTDQNAPTLMELLSGKGPEAAQAQYLAIAAAKLKENGWVPKGFQVALHAQSGATTIPAILEKDGQGYLVFSYRGPWDVPAYKNFLAWNHAVRSHEETAAAPILVVSTDDPVDLKKQVGERNGVFFASVPLEKKIA